MFWGLAGLWVLCLSGVLSVGRFVWVKGALFCYLLSCRSILGFACVAFCRSLGVLAALLVVPCCDPEVPRS